MHASNRCCSVAVITAAAIFWNLNGAGAAESYIPFTGDKTAWHGFDRYDFFLDETTLAIAPAEGKNQPTGQRRCIVVVPKEVAPGQPWSWQGCYWDHEPQAEVELLKRGFHIAYITADGNLRPDKKWDAWYEFLTGQHGLSKKPAFIGMSRGGEYAYTWGTTHPDQISCIYADNTGCNSDALAKLELLARNDVPLLHVCGSLDPLLARYSDTIEAIYHQFGGRISVLVKEGAGHHPHSLRDPKPIADFITDSVQAAGVAAPPPPLEGRSSVRSRYYALATSYRNFPSERNFVACRGPLFTECYDRYEIRLGFPGAVSVIVPKTAAPGKPWSFRASFVPRDAAVDQALLARGFHIVVGPVGYNIDGPVQSEWDELYKLLVDRGFSKKPVLEGDGGAAGEAYAWAIANPEKVSCVYGENPVFRSNMSKGPLLDQLGPLAKAGVPLLHVCGSLDPWLNDQTRVAEKRYKELGGQITVIVKEGEGHFPLAPRDVAPVVEFIVKAVN
jgi:pimeloyl-ACP methyl ester carboxylesterase